MIANTKTTVATEAIRRREESTVNILHLQNSQSTRIYRLVGGARRAPLPAIIATKITAREEGLRPKRTEGPNTVRSHHRLAKGLARPHNITKARRNPGSLINLIILVTARRLRIETGKSRALHQGGTREILRGKGLDPLNGRPSREKQVLHERCNLASTMALIHQATIICLVSNTLFME